MQNVIEEIREKLTKYIGEKPEPAFHMPQPSGRTFLRKIPLRNYAELRRNLPISWL